MTLHDLERRNSHIRIVISPNSVAFGADIQLIQLPARPTVTVTHSVAYVTSAKEVM